MKQKQYILYRYKINCVFIWVDFIKQGKIPCLFFSRDRTFSPPENGASSACLKASCRRSLRGQRQQDLPFQTFPTGHGISRNRQTRRMPFTIDIGSRTVPCARVRRCPCGNGVKGKVECRAPCTGVQMLARLSPFFTIFGARRCLPAVRGYPRREANGFLCALTSNRAVQVSAACFPAQARGCPSLQGRRRASSHGCLPVRDPVAGTAESMRRSGVSLRAGARMPTGVDVTSSRAARVSLRAGAQMPTL